jgi:hypothetical protein
VVERYISGQKGYEKADTVPVIDEEKEKLRAHKTWYTSLYNKLFKGGGEYISKMRCREKSKSFYIPTTYL